MRELLMPRYFAYGSNLDEAQMQRRCPGARRLATAHLPSYRLAFVGQSKWWGGSVATLFADASSRAPGLLYEITEAELLKLDRHEGAHRGAYKRVGVEVTSMERTLVEAFTYLHLTGTPGSPSSRYLEVLRKAYAAHGFDLAVLEAAAAPSSR